jgi:hypothetical protein
MEPKEKVVVLEFINFVRPHNLWLCSSRKTGGVVGWGFTSWNGKRVPSGDFYPTEKNSPLLPRI